MKRGNVAFGGMMPGIAPDLQPQEVAEYARDLTIEDGQIRKVADDLFIVTPAKAGTKVSIYKFGKAVTNDTDYWFHWLNDTDATRGPALTDASERTYYTESGQVPKVTDNSIALAGTSYPFASYTLGLPSPAAVTIGASGGTPDPATAVSVNVVITFVTAWGEEGPPSVASNLITINDGQTLTVTVIPGTPGGSYNVANVRIYASAFNSQGSGNFKFFGTVAIGAGSYAHTFSVAGLAESLQSPYLLAPPTDLFGIGLHPGKFLYGFSGRNFCRSEINRAHGWPAEYVDPVDYEIVGGAIIGASVVICTKRNTWIAEGGDPANQSLRRIEGLKYPAVSKRSITVTDSGVAYAADAGLVVVAPDGSGALLTEKMIGFAAWKAYKPSSFTSVFHRGLYIAFYNTGAATGSIVIDMVNKTLVESSIYATAAWSEPGLNGALYLQVGADIVKWRAGAGARTPLWRSPKRQLDHNKAWGAARVVANDYTGNITFKLIQDGTTTSTKTLANRKAVTLAMVKKPTYQYEVSGGDQIKSIEIGSSKLDFRSE